MSGYSWLQGRLDGARLTRTGCASLATRNGASKFSSPTGTEPETPQREAGPTGQIGKPTTDIEPAAGFFGAIRNRNMFGVKIPFFVEIEMSFETDWNRRR
ncbi:hypothetical protein [Rhizobium sp. CCGE531]|uniref:hypothetical protein n=1 Tax=Rhizobium sp. CCGE531 TaxID=2364271 RepID=UPI000EAAB4FF|nr:hypothetical protein [Rhizobium sp. CCGE531]AYG70697.1 hypothetical protein CCGE531_32560 [Rhizobium sp. CCGE531]